MDEAVPRSRHTDTHARPCIERTPYEPRSGRRPQVVLQSKESTRHRYHPYILRIERRTQYRSFHHVCQRGRHDLTVFTLHHPFADPHGRVLHQYGVRTYQAGGGRDLHQRHGRYRSPRFIGQDRGQYQSGTS